MGAREPSKNGAQKIANGVVRTLRCTTTSANRTKGIARTATQRR